MDIVDAGPEWEKYETELEVALQSEMATQIESILGEALVRVPGSLC